MKIWLSHLLGLLVSGISLLIYPLEALRETMMRRREKLILGQCSPHFKDFCGKGFSQNNNN